MLERGDLLALHEPLEGLHFLGPLTIGSQRFETAEELLAWLGDATEALPVFVKETVNPPVQELVLRDERFLAEARHTFLIRRPEEIAASWYALEGDMRILDTGLELLHELFVAVQNAGGHSPVVVESGDLVNRPVETMAAYCAAVGLPFIAEALSWEKGERAEWGRSSRWHQDTAASSGFVRPENTDRHRLASNPEVVRFARRHLPFYEMLLGHRLDIASQ